MKLEGKSLKRDFFRFIIPSIAAQWVYALYAMVDGLFIARGVSEIALSAVNIAVPFTTFLFAVALCFSVGSSTVIAIYLGQKNMQKAREVFTQNIITVIVLSMIITGVVVANARKLAIFLGAGRDTIENSTTYIVVIACFAIAFTVAYSLEVLIKTDGYPAKATIFVVLGCILNCVLDYIFVFVIHKGVWGAAFATGLSQACVVLMYLTHFGSKRTNMKLVKFKFDWGLVWRTVKIGAASGITEFSAGIVIFLFNHFILKWLGEDYIASYTIVSYINTITVMAMAGIIQGIQPLVSYYFGKNKPDKCISLLKYALICSGGLSVVIFGISWMFASPITNIFISERFPMLRQETIEAFHSFSWAFLICGINVILGGYFTAIERPREAMVVSLARGFLFVAVGLQLMTMWFGANGIWWSAVVSEGLCMFVSLLFWRHIHKNVTKN